MRVMYFDCFSGVAGDMVLGALLDAGLPLEELQQALGSLRVGHDLQVTRVLRAGLSATHVAVLGEDEAAHRHSDAHEHTHDHHHDHHHHHHHDKPDDHSHADHSKHVHRSLKEIAHLLDHSALSAAGKSRAQEMFRRLAEAEAAIHGMSVDEVHLHEVGAIDSIIDIAGVVFGLEWFGIDDIVSSPLNVGSGTVEIAHGTFPVPAPATLRLLQGVPIYAGEVKSELVTPTGALVISTYAKQFGAMPAMTTERIGYGAGTKDFVKMPNVVRVVIGERSSLQNRGDSGTTPFDSAQGAPSPVEGRNPGTNSVLRIECEIDDMSPQLFGPVTDALFSAGALDVFLTPIVMKKGRPGTLVTVLAAATQREAVCHLLFRETTTIGLRIETVERETLDREWVDVTIPGGVVRIKVARRHGEIVNAAPEFEDCVRLASTTGRPIKLVQLEAMEAWRQRARG